MAGKVQESLVNKEYGNWVVEEYLGKSIYNCRCKLCNTPKEINGYFLKNGKAPKCTCETGKSNKGRIDLTDKTFGTWKVLEYAGNKKWKCRCLCGCNTVRDVAGGDLRNGKSTGCGNKTNRNIDDLRGKQFGDWLVIEQGPSGEYGETQWLCECQCENKTRRLVTAHSLKSGKSKSCGHSTTGFKDLTNLTFGNWLVLYRASNVENKTMWTCMCNCEKGTIRDIASNALISGKSKSCGCQKGELGKQTSMSKYGVSHYSQIDTSRSVKQLDMVSSKESFIEVINSIGSRPTTIEIANVIGLDRASTMRYIHKYELEGLIDFGGKNSSTPERELIQLFPTIYKNNRSILEGKELDLYYPDKNFAIEFNGNYWHSEVKKSEIYHQKKSIEALKKGVRIFHIFEYEWDDEDTKQKIYRLIRNKLYPDKTHRVYARDCEIKIIGDSDAKKFLEENHLQGYTKSSINIGLIYHNNIVGIMTFGAPRFNSDFQYELIRLAFDLDTIVVGGTQRMFKYFLTNYNPTSIISYCDISKFSGSTYTELGFTLSDVTRPNYKWVGYDTFKVLNRYQTQKQRLIEKGLGTEDQTEAEIMHNLGYVRVYDCGNFRYTWKK